MVESPVKRQKIAAASSSDSSSDDEAPAAEPIERQAPPAPSPEPVVCAQWARNGRCELGAACPHPHLGRPQQSDTARREIKAPRTPFSKNTGSLLGRLLARDVAQSVSDLAHVIDFLAANDWLRDTELVPGQADDAPITVQDAE